MGCPAAREVSDGLTSASQPLPTALGSGPTFTQPGETRILLRDHWLALLLAFLLGVFIVGGRR